jgi:hypothetical protein
MAVIVAPLTTVLVGMTAGAVMTAPDPPTEAPALMLAIPPLVGRTPASRVMLPKLPKPKVMHASTAAPSHEVETAVTVLPETTTLVGTTAGAETAGVVAAPPRPILPPRRPPAPIKPKVTVAKGPTPSWRQTRLSQVVETAVISAPEILVGVASTPALSPTRPSDPIAPRLKVARGPTPSVIQTASLQEVERDVISGIETDALAVVGGVVMGEPPTPGSKPPTPAPRSRMVPSV